jgi:Flp pilus assembly protein TadG
VKSNDIRTEAPCRWVPESDDAGAVALLVAILIPLFLVLCGISVDVGRWYVEAQRVQNAADAAAMAGVTWLPQNTDLQAFTTARSVAQINGYPNSAVTTYVGGKPSQLFVSITTTVNNVFGAVLGRPTTTITRAAMADYAAPAIMGSPCNALGNQPPSTSSAAQPVGTVIPTTSQGGYAACQLTPAFWMNIAGPATNKVSGDRYATKTNCSGADLCTGTTNAEYDKNGYIYVVRVQPDAVGQRISLQLYDPAFVYTGDVCDTTVAPTTSTITATVNNKARTVAGVATLTTSSNHGFAVGDSVTVTLGGTDGTFNGTFVVTATPTSRTFSYANSGNTTSSTAATGTAVHPLSMINPYAPDSTAVAARYARDANTNSAAKMYCPGDQNLNTGDHLNTSFVLREQTDSLDPFDSVKSPPIFGCSKQYASLRSGAPSNAGTLVAPSAAQLTATDSHYDPDLAQVFHQWVEFCEFTPTRTGDYYLQVRTNVPLVGAKDGNDYVYNVSSGIQLTDPAVLDETGSGHNRFAIRAALSTAETPPALGAEVSVAGWQRMSIYTNASGASSTFNLVQVLPNSAGNSFNFAAYDNGDASCPNRGDCTLEVSMPADAVSTDGRALTFNTCVGTGPETTPTTGPCTFNVSGNNGKIQIITVPIPTNYGCDDASPGGCWFRVTARFPAAVSDTVTYGTEIIEDPVRLIN